MARPRSRIKDYLTYLAVRVLVCVVQALPRSAAWSLARGLAWLAHRIDRRHRLVAEENIRHAFPHFDDAIVRQLARANYDHLLLMVIEMIRLPRAIHRGTWERHIPYARAGEYDRAMAMIATGRPLMILTGHFGNWECMSYAIGVAGFHASLIARRLDNPWLDRFINQFRRKTGQVILDKNADYDRILKVLGSGGYVGMVGDQDAGPRGLFVPFLGRPASTYKSIALLSLQFSAPILVLAAARVGGPMQYQLYLEDVILPEEFQSSSDPVRGITQRYSDALARLVLRHPEQYFWVHRRWKHQPPVKARQAA